ncbi:MAG TPA: alkaline phosphatase family protein, partial [Thermoanaerobaculia bacterium]|nr:alkaline phosphatase family protein [Thermoanaerobaculia bacterium]
MSKKLLFAVSFAIAVSAAAADPPVTPRKPKLILQITIDQLRGDLPFRYADRFSPRGFRLFMDHGIWYADAQHEHGEYETVVGHTTLATGAWPSRHGMITNSAFNQYGIGTPTGIPVTTFSDELNITTYGGAKIFAVSMKDRAAVPMAGHTGTAFWYSGGSGCFVTNTAYYGPLPQWVTDWCATKPADRYANTEWVQLQNPDSYLFKDFKNVYPKRSVAEENMLFLEKYRFRRTFPHPLGSGAALYQNLMLTPQGDMLTADFAKELIRKEGLGRDDTTDYLALCLSLTDFIAHWFSPSSLESEDNLLRLDRTLESFFAFIDA